MTGHAGISNVYKLSVHCLSFMFYGQVPEIKFWDLSSIWSYKVYANRAYCRNLVVIIIDDRLTMTRHRLLSTVTLSIVSCVLVISASSSGDDVTADPSDLELIKLYLEEFRLELLAVKSQLVRMTRNSKLLRTNLRELRTSKCGHSKDVFGTFALRLRSWPWTTVLCFRLRPSGRRTYLRPQKVPNTSKFWDKEGRKQTFWIPGVMCRLLSRNSLQRVWAGVRGRGAFGADGDEWDWVWRRFRINTEVRCGVGYGEGIFWHILRPQNTSGREDVIFGPE